MQVGIVGLPQSGKTTLFNALTGGSIEAHTGARQNSHIAVVKVPDRRLERLRELFQPKKITPTTVQYVDVAGLEKGVSDKGGLSEHFLGKLRTVDALLVVIRLFEHELIPHPEHSIDAERDLEIITAECLLSDLNIVENRTAKLEKTAPKTKDPDELHELELMRKFKGALEEETPLRELPLAPLDLPLIRGYQFLTIKPILVVLNIGEAQLSERDRIIRDHAGILDGSRTALTAVCAEMEMEIEQLEEEEADLFFKEMGIEEPALSRLVRESHALLDLLSFFTFVSDEVRAWTIPKGATAKEAAGAVHSDMERGFIRAEVVSFEHLNQLGSMQACREKGLIRLEGKEYLVQDGDVITFRFNV